MLFDKLVPFLDKHYAFKDWLYAWERFNLPMLREMSAGFKVSQYLGKVTLLIYSFGSNENDFDIHEFPILHTWRVLGKLPVSIITGKPTRRHLDFQAKYPDLVSIRTTIGLVDANVDSMSQDCMMNLHSYFTTPYCLIIQDDGFPLQDTLGRYLGKWDYIGAPNVQDSFRQHIADIFLRDGLNGGFCLRSRRYCKAVTWNWRVWGRLWASWRSRSSHDFKSEDFLYVCMTRINPFTRLRYRVPGAKIAREFAFYDLLGAWRVPSLTALPFGVHGQSTIWQYRQVMRDFGYDLTTPFQELS
ncbi:MAG: hypothetical protein MJ240_05855 [Kiritimatiellae bacterium]|nr:hypothetical protein [Kiritimatiellia bacterium]